MLPFPEESPAEGGPSGLLAVLVLAVLQGLAEFLPISSSGHLALGRAVLGLREAGLALDVALHVGTLVAVAAAYRAEVAQLLRDCLRGNLRMAAWLVVATLPATAAGLGARGLFEEAAQSVTAAGVGLLVTALLLVMGERARRHPPEDPRGANGSDPRGPQAGYGRPAWAAAVAMGTLQVLALWPGVSRSGTTIVAGLCLGLPAHQAARLSFLMSLPVVSGAALLELPSAFQEGFAGVSVPAVLLATAVAALVGWLALRALLLVLQRGALWAFSAYCALVGAIALTVL